MSRLFSSAAKLGVSGAILAYIFSKIPAREVAAVLAAAKPELVALAIAVSIISVYVSALRLKALTDQQRMVLSVHQLAAINFAATFHGLWLPGYLAGGAIRWYKLAGPKKQGAGALVSIALSRIIWTVSLLAFGCVFLLLDEPGRIHPAAPLVLVGLLIPSVLVWALVAHPRLVTALGARLAGGPAWLPRQVRDKTCSVLEALRQSHGASWTWSARMVGLAFIEYAIGLVAAWLLADALGLRVPLISLGWIRACLQVLSALPVSISGLGVREGAMVVLLEPLGVSPTGAVAFSLLFFARTLVVAAIGGLLEARAFFSHPRAEAPAP